MADLQATERPLRALDGAAGPARRRVGRLGRGPRPEAVPALTEAPAPATVLLRDGAFRKGLALADVAAAAAALSLVLWLSATTEVEPRLLLLTPLLVVVNKLAGLYDRDDLVLNKTTLDEGPTLLQVSGLFALIVWLVHPALLDARLEARHVLGLWAAGTVLTIGARAVARRITARLEPPERCLLVGSPSSMDGIEEKLAVPHIPATVVERVTLRPGQGVAWVAERLPWLVREHDVHRVVIAPLSSDGADTLDLIRAAKALGVRVSVLPRLLEVVGSSVTVDQIDGLTMLGVRSFGLNRSSRAVKRAFDLAGSSLLLLAVAPIIAALALAIRLDSRGGIFFRQTRVGRDGRRFEILKFRSMVVDAEDRKASLRHLNETDGLFKIAADPRVTRVGRFMRATSLDELPQLLNVWCGEMSLVGPRPLVVDEDAKVAGHDRARLHLTPGMTGHWQILGSARVPLGEMVGIDYLYVANWSLWTDVKILLRTIPYVLARGGI
jgi:exopolysaccharide biosynthesis polyprenyl glycosylphosphotransferase